MNRVLRSVLSVLLGTALFGAVAVSVKPDRAEPISPTGTTISPTASLERTEAHRRSPAPSPSATSVPPHTARSIVSSKPTPTSRTARIRQAPAATGYQEYVALGDSWSADVVVADLHGLPDDTSAPMDCAQSHVNYPKLVAKALGITNFRDATCGSATTDHFANPQADLPLGGTNPPQFDRLTRTTDLVTVGIGGNDAGFAGGAFSCLSLSPVSIPLALPLPDLGIPFVDLTNPPTGGCKERFTKGGVDVLAERIEQSEPKLVAAYTRIRQLAPNARILAINYLAAIPEHGCWPFVPFTNSDIEYLYSTFQQLNAMVARAAAKAGVELVDTYTPTLGHHVCSGPRHRYVEGLGVISLNDLAIAVPAHPNSAGAAAQARAVLAALR